MELGPTLRAMSRNKLRFGLIAAQIAVTLAIVANCVTLIQDARRKMSYPKTFDEDNLILIHLPCQDAALRDIRRRTLWIQESRERLRGIAGVQAVSGTSFTPNLPRWWWSVKAAGSHAAMTTILYWRADERLPDVFGMELAEGRWFSREVVDRWGEWRIAETEKPRERNADGKVLEPIVVDAVISRALGQHIFGDVPLLGKMLEDNGGDLYRIVGVLGRYYAHTAGSNIHPEHAIFVPGFYNTYNFGAIFAARAEPGQAAVVARRIEEELSATFDITDKSVWLVSEGNDIIYGPQQMTVALMGHLAVLLLVVTSLGIAGLTSFSVTERTRHIGTRRALGATTSDILRYFLTEAGLLTTVGLLFGAGLAVLLNMALLRVYTDAKLSAGVVAASALLLWIVGLGAALPPALRGARTSPAIATRNV